MIITHYLTVIYRKIITCITRYIYLLKPAVLPCLFESVSCSYSLHRCILFGFRELVACILFNFFRSFLLLCRFYIFFIYRNTVTMSDRIQNGYHGYDKDQNRRNRTDLDHLKMSYASLSVYLFALFNSFLVWFVHKKQYYFLSELYPVSCSILHVIHLFR